MQETTGPEKRKLAPRLRQILSDDLATNALRAEWAPDLVIPDPASLSSLPRLEAPSPSFASPIDFSKPAGQEMIREETGLELVNAFVELSTDDLQVPKSVRELVTVTGRKQNLLTVMVRKHDLESLSRESSVLAVDPGERIVFSPPIELAVAGEPDAGTRQVDHEPWHRGGAGVLIGLVDVGGFDFAHPDFLDTDGQTRFVRIWDQGGDTRPPPQGFNYGAELAAKQMNAALAAAPDYGIPPQRLEPQSQMAESSHATHVASIAAGRRGICPNALIAGVLLSFPTEGGDPRRQFHDSTRIAHAVDYLFALGQSLGVPVSINISLGTNGHAHDASSPVSRWIDRALTTWGRSVSVAAGNAGQEAPARPGDLGFVMGRIHTAGRIPAAGLSQDIEWIVGGDGIVDISDNELVIWYGSQDRFAVKIRPPDSDQWTEWVYQGQYLETSSLPGNTQVRIYNDVYVPANGHNRITCQLSPHHGEQGVLGIRSGTWLVRLHGLDVRDGAYHGWIERDDPRRMAKLGYEQDWSFPSFFSSRSNVDDSSISSLACGYRIIAVANLDAKNERLHITSSQGPTRDGRQKPEIAAPGTNIVAANGFSMDPEQLWVSMTGTSMASPYVAGVAGLMLSVDRHLTADQIAGIMRRTAMPLPGTDYRWQNSVGFGGVDPHACVREAYWIHRQRDGSNHETDIISGP